jgi:hypothetical protein
MSTLHQFGSIIHADDLGTMLDTKGCAIPTGYAVLHADLQESRVEQLEDVLHEERVVIACEISSQLIGHDNDLLNVVYLFDPEHAGAIAAGLEQSAKRLGEEYYQRFKSVEGLIEDED